MANVAASMTLSLRQQNGLNLGLEELKIQRGSLREAGGCGEQQEQRSHNSTLPFVRFYNRLAQIAKPRGYSKTAPAWVSATSADAAILEIVERARSLEWRNWQTHGTQNHYR